jgi:acetyl esterase/lipase
MYAAPDRPPDQADVEYARPDGRPLGLDIYLARAVARGAPLVMLIHGGGWRIGSKAQFRHVAERFADAGFNAVTIDYRLSDVAPFPAQLHDCKAAVRWARSQAAHYGWDPGRIAIMGDSSGAHLAALVGLTVGERSRTLGATTIDLAGTTKGEPDLDTRVQAVIDFFGYTDFRPVVDGSVPEPGAFPAFFGGSIKGRPEIARLASPIFYVSPSAPPFFIAQGTNDQGMLGQSKALAAALDAAEVPHSLYLVSGGGHGDDAFYRGDPLPPVFAFLRRVFGIEGHPR